MSRYVCPRCSNYFSSVDPQPRCPKCGFSTAGPSGTSASPAYQPVAPTASPYGTAPVSLMPPPVGATAAVAATTNGFAITSLVMGILTVFTVGLTAYFAVLFGIVAHVQIKKRGQKGEGMAIAGIVLGTVFIALHIIAGVTFWQIAENF